MKTTAYNSKTDTVVLVGGGDLTQNRVLPALKRLGRKHPIQRAVLVDILPECPVDLSRASPPGMPMEYVRVDPNSLLPLERFARNGWLGEHVLAYIATPTEYHLWYAKQLAGTGCRIAVEKPLTKRPSEARELTYFADGHIFAVGHQLFKAAMLAFLQRCRANGLKAAAAARFDMLETKGVGNRTIDDAIWDLGWHGGELLIATYRAAGLEASIHTTRVLTATYRPPPGEPSPHVFTAARWEGFVRVAGTEMPFTFCMGKALGHSRKRLAFTDASGATCIEVPLDESGWRAHGRLLRELLTADRPDMKLQLPDALGLVRACNEAGAAAQDEGAYAFGVTPEFLQEPVPAGFASLARRRSQAPVAACADCQIPVSLPV